MDEQRNISVFCIEKKKSQGCLHNVSFYFFLFPFMINYGS